MLESSHIQALENIVGKDNCHTHKAHCSPTAMTPQGSDTSQMR